MYYLVKWEIELAAEDPVKAAVQARCAQLRRRVRATVFDVYGEDNEDAVRVDLAADADEEVIPEPEAQGVFNSKELAAVLSGLKLLRAAQTVDQIEESRVESGLEFSPYGIHSVASQLREQPGLSREEIDSLSKRIEVALA